MNNKGQALVLFVLLAPILLLILGVVINFGMTSIAKKNVDINIKNIIKNNMDDINELDKEDIKNEINKLITINLGNVDATVTVDEKITISVTKKINSIFTFLLDNDNLYYQVTYEGILDNDKIQIIRR